jgi:hypothetical protein
MFILIDSALLELLTQLLIQQCSSAWQFWCSLLSSLLKWVQTLGVCDGIATQEIFCAALKRPRSPNRTMPRIALCIRFQGSSRRKIRGIPILDPTGDVHHIASFVLFVITESANRLGRVWSVGSCVRSELLTAIYWPRNQ